MEQLETWKTEVTDYLVEVNNQILQDEEAKNLYYGSYAIDGKLIPNPKILFVGINPGKGNGERDYLIEIEKGDRLSYVDHLDGEYHYHLAKANIDLFYDVGLNEQEVYGLLERNCVKTNFNYLITDNEVDLNKVVSKLNAKNHFHKCCEFTLGLIKALKPQIVIFEGKGVYNNIVRECIGENKSWSKENDFGYYFAEVDNCHYIGYSRVMSNIKSNKKELAKKLREILN